MEGPEDNCLSVRFDAVASVSPAEAEATVMDVCY